LPHFLGSSAAIAATGSIDTRHEFRGLFDLYVPIGLAVFFIITAVVLYAVIRYRRRGDEVPRARSEAPVPELLYVIGLAVIVALLVWKTFDVESKVDRTARRPGLDVRVTASKWNWRFTYPRYGITQFGGTVRPAVLVVPTGTTVRFDMASLDVIHSFFVPSLRFKRDAFPEKSTRFDLVFERPGSTVGRCAEFCGLHHADMLFDVRALRPNEFTRWVMERRAGTGTRG
jgi:cytochrome c oxidase subunit II